MDNTSAYPSSSEEIVEAKGVWLTEKSGRRVLDACSGTFNVGLGYGHTEVKKALIDTIEKGILHGSSSIKPRIIEEASSALVSIAPRGLDRCHLKGATGGSTAVEQAIRHAWAISERRGIVSFESSHHGQTIATSLVSGMNFRKKRISNASLPVLQVPFPDCYRCPFRLEPSSCSLECVQKITAAIDSWSLIEGPVAAFIAEPILGAGGGLTPPTNFWPKFSSKLRDRGILIITDEVQTFGRTGEFLASLHYEIDAQMICLGKSISGIGVPGAGALLLPKSFCVLEEGERSLTSGGSSLVASAIKATIQIMKDPEFFSRMNHSCLLLNNKLQRLEHKYESIGCIRGVGLMTGLEIVKSKASRHPDAFLALAIARECRNIGLLLRTSFYGKGSFLKIRPAMTITCDEIEELVRRLDCAIQRVLAKESNSSISPSSKEKGCLKTSEDFETTTLTQ